MHSEGGRSDRRDGIVGRCGYHVAIAVQLQVRQIGADSIELDFVAEGDGSKGALQKLGDREGGHGCLPASGLVNDTCLEMNIIFIWLKEQ